MKYANIIIDISIGKLDKTYQYRVPDRLSALVSIGSTVTVTFGSAKRKIKGYVISFSDVPAIEESRIKDIEGVSVKDLPIEDRMISLACYIRENFGGTLNEALKIVMPVKKTVKQKLVRDIGIACSREELEEELSLSVKKGYKARERLLLELLKEGCLDYDTVVEKLMISRQTINSLLTRGILSIKERTSYRNPHLPSGSKEEALSLNEEQSRIAEDIITDYDKGIRDRYLIHGVTGSGKTEVYMAVIEKVIQSGRQVIMLIPEIALTYQTVMRFYRRFGERISILNSRMSAGERYDQSMRAKNGEIDIMIGPRSALFTPFERLGLIVIDEEHEESYKNEGIPHYDARIVAMKRGSLEGASVIFGSATPSLETYNRCQKGLVKLYELNNRAGAGTKPEVHIVDLREELRVGNRSIFSRKLIELLEDRLRKKEQTMLFLNRRGYSGFVSCRSCGKTIKCPHCDISLTRHFDGRLVCHYCGFEEKGVDKCPICGSKYIGSFGIGTEKIEEQLKNFFPEARVLRMDADSTKGKTGHEEILSAFKNGEADILVGTQMIVKGHDFHNVTLVGILAADMSLGVADYRAAERTYDLLAQASGRAGRGEKSGEVVIQTYQPDHFSIVSSAQDDYKAFFTEEMAYRRLMGYPPAAHMLQLLCLTARESDSRPHSKYIAGLVKNIIDRAGVGDRVKLMGPSEASLKKANDIYRETIYLKSDDYDLLVKIKNALADILVEDKNFREASVQFDFDPR